MSASLNIKVNTEEIETIVLKICSQCEKEKDENEFGTSNGRKRAACKKCMNIDNKIKLLQDKINKSQDNDEIAELKIK